VYLLIDFLFGFNISGILEDSTTQITIVGANPSIIGHMLTVGFGAGFECSFSRILRRNGMRKIEKEKNIS
jgi:hypothetical protein